MDVEAAVFRDIENGFGQNLAVGNDDDDVRLKAFQFFNDVIASHGIGLEHGNAEFDGFFLHRRKGHLLPASPLFIRLGIDGRHVMRRLSSWTKDGTEKSGVPMNTMRKLSIIPLLSVNPSLFQ